MKWKGTKIHRYAGTLGLFVMTLGCGSPQPVQEAPPEGSYETGSRRVSIDGTTETVPSAVVSREFFARETAQPMLGRTFVEPDYGSSSPAVALLGHDLWTARFGGSPEIIGRTIEIDRTPTVVVGVMPRGFRQPDDTSVWLPKRSR
jgi:hypothetical protein